MVLDKENSSSKGYRSRLEIIRDILLVARNANSPGSKKTHIMYGANLSYKLLARYLEEVLNAGLLCEVECCYAITTKGEEFIQVYEDYERESIEFQKHSIRLNNGKDELEKLLLVTG